jgi:hypothetical protein
LGLGKAGLGKLVNEVIHPAKSTVITQKMITELAHCVTYEPFETGEAAKKLHHLPTRSQNGSRDAELKRVCAWLSAKVV